MGESMERKKRRKKDRKVKSERRELEKDKLKWRILEKK
jgi:hypothetical protein